MTWNAGPVAFGDALEEVFSFSAGGDHGFRVAQWYSDLQASAVFLSYGDGADQVVTLTNTSGNTISGVTASLKDSTKVSIVSHCGSTLRLSVTRKFCSQRR